MVVLDPPAFTKSRKNLEAAGGAYKEINLRALRLLPPGGVLVTCSCSHHMSEAALLEVVAQASLDAKRTLARTGAPHAEPGSSDSVDGARDALFEVSGAGSGLAKGDRARADASDSEE